MIRSLIEPQLDPDADNTILPGRNLSVEALGETLLADTMVWVDVVDPTDDEIKWLETTLSLHPTVVKDLKRIDRRPSVLVHRKYIFLSLFEPDIHLRTVLGKEIHCLIGQNYFVTVHRSEADTVKRAYDRVAQNTLSWGQGVEYFLYLTAQNVIDAYYPLLDNISNELNALEESLLTKGTDKVEREKIYRLKQQLIQLRQMVAPQREVVSTIIGTERLMETNEARDLFRHLYDRLLRVYDVIDSQRDLSSNVLDMMQSQESSRMVDAVNRLTIFSMIFLPLTFLSGLFELNFATTSDQIVLPISGQLMFVLVITLMVASAGMMLYIFRRRGWL